MTAAMVTGQDVDPAAGRVTFREYAERWRATQAHRPTTAAHVETMLRRHVYPATARRHGTHFYDALTMRAEGNPWLPVTA